MLGPMQISVTTCRKNSEGVAKPMNEVTIYLLPLRAVQVVNAVCSARNATETAVKPAAQALS
jgi:hypothetical protein